MSQNIPLEVLPIKIFVVKYKKKIAHFVLPQAFSEDEFNCSFDAKQITHVS